MAVNNTKFVNIFKDVDQQNQHTYISYIYELLSGANFTSNSDLRTVFKIMDSIDELDLSATDTILELNPKEKALLVAIVYNNNAMPSGELFLDDTYNFRRAISES